MSVDTQDKLTTKVKWSADTVRRALREKYPPNAYAVMFEVANATAMQKSRSADALIMSLWPSRGLELIGVEIKVSRSDLKKELDDPSKAEPVCKFCDRWYLACGEPGMLKPGELPPTWGLMERRGDKLVIVHEAPKLTPEPIDRAFLAGVLRGAQDQLNAAKVEEAALSKARSEGWTAGVQHAETTGKKVQSYELERAQSERDRLRDSIEAFQKASGVKIDQWGNRQIGVAVKLVLDSGLPYIKSQLGKISEDMQRLADETKYRAEHFMKREAEIKTEGQADE